MFTEKQGKGRMEIKWSMQAEASYLDNLNYWDNRNKSYTYSDKIEAALCELEEENLIRIIHFRSNKQKPL